MNRLYRFCVFRPWLVLVIGVLACLAVSPGILRLRLRTDGHALVPPNAPEIAIDSAVRERFHLQDPIVVVIWSQSAGGIFNPHSLKLIGELTDAFKTLDGVDADQVFSLATEFGDRVFPGTLIFRRLLDPLPQTPQECEQLRNDLRAYRLYNGMLVSQDEQGAAILVGAAPGVNRVELFGRLQQIVGAHELRGEDVSIIGAPVAEALLGTYLLADLGVPNAILGIQQPAQEAPSTASGFFGLRQWIARTVGLVPIALLVMGGVFYFYFRSLAAVALPMMEVAACLVFVFSLMGWTGVPVYLTIAVMPIILTAAGVTDEVHVFARYRDRLRLSPDADHREILLETLSEIGRPVLMAGVTTGLGFLAFVFSPIAPVQAFGVFTAAGLAFCMVWSLTVIPASLAIIDPRRITRRAPSAQSPADSRPRLFFGLLARIVIEHPIPVLAVAGVLAGLSVLGISKVVVQDSWIDGFAPQSEFRQATSRFDEQFQGGHILLVEVDTGQARLEGELETAALDGLWTRIKAKCGQDLELEDWRFRLARMNLPIQHDPALARQESLGNTWTTWITEATCEGDSVRLKGIPSHGFAKLALRLEDKDRVHFELTPSRLLWPQIMQQLADLEAFLAGHTDRAVGGVVGTADYLETIHYLRRGRKDEHRGIPKTTEEIDWLWREYRRMRGDERVRQLIDADFSKSIITVFLREANFIDTGVLMRNIRDYEREKLAPQGIRLSFAGDVAVSQTLISAIVGTQVISVVAALAGDLAVTVILGRSLVFGLLCVVPSLLAVLLNFAVMGWLGMPLGVATSMFSSMTLGMGVDFAIHFLQAYRTQSSQSSAQAIIEAAKITGPPILGNTLAVTLGFGVLMLSQVPANARLGALLVLSLFNCFAATMVLLPAVLALRGGRRASSSVAQPHQAAVPLLPLGEGRGEG